MVEPGLHDGRGPDRWWGSPLVWAAGAWIAGLLVGRELGGTWIWVAVAVSLLIVNVLVLWRGRSAVSIALVVAAIVATAGGWWNFHLAEGGTWGLEPELVSRLACVEGVVEDRIFVTMQAKGLMGAFSYRPPSVTFTLAAERVLAPGGWRAMRGRVLVHVPQYDDRLRPGDRVQCTGWISAPQPPANPGERDMQRQMHDQGVIGRLTLSHRGNCRVIMPVEESRGWGGRIHGRLRDGTAAALRYGFGPSASGTLDLLEVLLLGDWRGDLEGTRLVFRRSGLMHVLAISGLHLGILISTALIVLVALTGRPRVAALGALALVGLFILIVPPGVAVRRAGLMAAAACLAMAAGRRVSPMAAMCGAGLVILIWRPQDLLSPGFQLSFAVVAALLTCAGRVRDWLAPPPLVPEAAPSYPVRRWAAGYVAVGIVAWCASAPLMAYHFGMVVPAGLGATLLAVPIVALLLWFGYLKILITAVAPPLGAGLARPLEALGEALSAIATFASGWPAGALELPRPTITWAVVTVIVVAVALYGGFARRRWAGAAAIGLCAVWAMAPVAVEVANDRWEPDLRVHMLAVGHGSCYVLRSAGQTLVFDCGSGEYLDITTAAVGPALRSLGITRVNTLILSHPDMDHISGTLELADGFLVDRVLLTRAFQDAAGSSPAGPAAFLLEQLARRGVQIEVIAAGWSEQLGRARLTALWPPPHAKFQRANDASIVLAVQAAGRRVLLTGDIENEAMASMLQDLDRDQLRADVLELPHHGAIVPATLEFVRAVRPSVVLQSAGRRQLRDDRWLGLLEGVTRHVTALHGAVEIAVAADGSISHRRFREAPRPVTRPYNAAWLPSEVNP